MGESTYAHTEFPEKLYVLITGVPDDVSHARTMYRASKCEGGAFSIEQRILGQLGIRLQRLFFDSPSVFSESPIRSKLYIAEIIRKMIIRGDPFSIFLPGIASIVAAEIVRLCVIRHEHRGFDAMTP